MMRDFVYRKHTSLIHLVGISKISISSSSVSQSTPPSWSLYTVQRHMTVQRHLRSLSHFLPLWCHPPRPTPNRYHIAASQSVRRGIGRPFPRRTEPPGTGLA